MISLLLAAKTQAPIPAGLNLGAGNTVPWTIVFTLTLLTLVPAILLSMTPMVRLLVVFHFLRQALGTQTAPSNQVLMGLGLMMTWFLMQPVLVQVDQQAVEPFRQAQISGWDAIDRGVGPVKTYMLRYAREKDLALFVSASMTARPAKPEDLPMRVVVPAYILSELKAGFEIGAVLFLPFLLVDMVVASITTSIGMYQLTDRGRWVEQLEAEFARELGQAVSLTAGGDAPQPESSWCDALEVESARLMLAVDREDLAGFLVESRLIEAGQADAQTVRELWTGILASVAARLGGRAETCDSVEEFPAEPCAMRLGQTTMRVALAVLARASRRADAEAQRAEGAWQPEEILRQAARTGNYDLLLEVELNAAVRFGSRELELKELLELGPGDVVELDRRVADPVDLIVGDKIVARGEVVLVNGNFGLRVTEVAEPMRRLESIRCIS